MNELCFVHSMANNVSQGNALSVVLFVYTSTSLLEVVTQYGLKRHQTGNKSNHIQGCWRRLKLQSRKNTICKVVKQELGGKALNDVKVIRRKEANVPT